MTDENWTGRLEFASAPHHLFCTDTLHRGKCCFSSVFLAVYQMKRSTEFCSNTTVDHTLFGNRSPVRYLALVTKNYLWGVQTFPLWHPVSHSKSVNKLSNSIPIIPESAREKSSKIGAAGCSPCRAGLISQL